MEEFASGAPTGAGPVSDLWVNIRKVLDGSLR
jgi:hypothetical protein